MSFFLVAGVSSNASNVSRPDLRAVYMSGYAENALRQQRVLHTSHAFVQKPFTRQGLTRAVRETLAG